MIKIQTIFCWVITAIMCVYFNFYTLSKISSFFEKEHYAIMEKVFDDINQRLKKETSLNVKGEPFYIQMTFDTIINNDKENQEDFKQGFRDLMKNKTTEFLTIMKTKKVTYNIKAEPTISDYLSNKTKEQTAQLDSLGRYLDEHIAATEGMVGNYSKQKILKKILEIISFSFLLSLVLIMYLIMQKNAISINSIYIPVIVFSVNIPVFFIHWLVY